MMQNFNFDYDLENDDLFLYLENKKSKGAVELGNFIIDLDENKEVVAIEIMNAKKVFSDAVSKILDLTNIESINVWDFRNTGILKIDIRTKNDKVQGSISIPNLRYESPALSY